MLTYPRTFSGEPYPIRRREQSIVPLLSTRVFTFVLEDTIDVTDPFTTENEHYFTLQDTITVVDSVGKVITIYEVSITDTVTVSETLNYRFPIFRVSITDTVTVTESVKRASEEYFFSLTDTVTVTDNFRRTYEYSLEHIVGVFETVKGFRLLEGKFADKATLIESYDYEHSVIKDLTDTPTLIESYKPSLSTTRTIEEILTPWETWTPVLLTTNINHPPVPGGTILYLGRMTLIGSESSINLPQPEFDDSIIIKDQVQVRRTLNGKTRSYVKRAGAVNLDYTWILGYPKALELKHWFMLNNAKMIQIHNWKGEIWFAFVTTDEIVLDNVGKWQGSSYQKVSVSLTFEGNRHI